MNKLFQACIKQPTNQGFQLVELDERIVLCLFEEEASANAPTSTIMKFDYNLKIQTNIGIGVVIMHANAHENKLYLLVTSSDRKSKHIHAIDEHIRLLLDIPLCSTESLPLYVPKSVSKMKVTENYFVFLDGTNVLLMDRLDGRVKRTFNINSSDFVLDLSADRLMAYDGKLGKLVCFGFEGESFEIGTPGFKKNYDLVDYDHQRFVFFDMSSFFVSF